MTKSQAIKKVINVATDEIGYLEKASNKDLDSKTGNAGYNNYTKYWRDVYPAFQGQPWCACFISWVFMKAFGLDMAKKLLKHWPFTYCPTLAGMTTNKSPKKGSIALFWRNGEYAHTELVIEVTDLSIITIGGNTSAGSSVVPNGGGVYRKTYARAGLDSRNKYFMPDYSILSDTSTSDTPTTTPPSAAPSAGKVGTCTVTLGQFIVGSKDPEIKTIQIILNGMGYKGKDGKALTVDGDLGENTAYAITNLQKAGGMKDINFGTVAAGTWKLLLQ